MNRIIIEAHEVVDDRAVLRDGRADHIRNILQVGVGDGLKVGVADGACGTGHVLHCDAASVELALTLTDDSPQPWCDLILAMPRPRVLKRLWAQVTALGVGRIILVQAARVEKCYFGSHWLRDEAYRPLLLEGLMQAGTTRVPIVQLEPNLKRFFAERLTAITADAACFIAHPDDTPLLSPAIMPHDTRRVVLAVGPEGGWLDDERELFEAHGFARLSLGTRILRTDTACVALLAVLGQAFDPAAQHPLVTAPAIIGGWPPQAAIERVAATGGHKAGITLNHLQICDETTQQTYYGCSQEWYRDEWQRRSGCGPTVASTLLLYLSHTRPDLGLAPVPDRKADAVAFMEDVWHFVTPGQRGIPTTEIWTQAVAAYAQAKNLALDDRFCDIPQQKDSRPSFGDLVAFIQEALLQDLPIAFLALCQGDEKALDNWHWVTLVSLDCAADATRITVLDNGSFKSIDLALWYQTTDLGGGFATFAPRGEASGKQP